MYSVTCIPPAPPFYFFVCLVIARESSRTTKSSVIGPKALSQCDLQPGRSMCQQRGCLGAEGAIYFSRFWDQKFQLFCVETWRPATWRSLTGAERESLSGHRVVRAALAQQTRLEYLVRLRIKESLFAHLKVRGVFCGGGNQWIVSFSGGLFEFLSEECFCLRN